MPRNTRIGWVSLVTTTVLAALLLIVCSRLPAGFQSYHAAIIRVEAHDGVIVPDALFPDIDSDTGWMAHNSRALRALLACLAEGVCAPRQADVVILASRHFLGARRGEVGGEAIWANSMMAAFDELGYTTLFADNIQRAVTLHALFPSLVRAVVANEWDMQPCAKDAAACIRSAQNPLGIPLWKLFSFSFFKGVDAPLPLGERWVLAPEAYAGSRHVHIGYSVERTCAKRPPAVEREPIAYVLGKHKVYWQERFYMWEGVDWTGPPANLTEELGLALPENFKFVACVDNMYAEDPERALPDGIENMCGEKKKMLAQDEFVKKLAASRFLVGVGRPWVSPTPYDALCLGVPFLNPIHSWDKHHPADREKWITQHDGMKFEETPLVYHVYKSPSLEQRNRDFWTSVLRAVNTPIERHVPERMTMAAVKRRVDGWLQHDWKGEAQKAQEEQTAFSFCPPTRPSWRWYYRFIGAHTIARCLSPVRPPLCVVSKCANSIRDTVLEPAPPPSRGVERDRSAHPARA